MAYSHTHDMLREEIAYTRTGSIASTPLACVTFAPFTGNLIRAGAVAHGSFTGDCSIAVAIIKQAAPGVAPGAGTAVDGSPIVLTASNSAAGTSAFIEPQSSNYVTEGDLIKFTPSGATGTTIGATCFATITKA